MDQSVVRSTATRCVAVFLFVLTLAAPSHADLQVTEFYPTGICEALDAGGLLVLGDGASVTFWDATNPASPVEGAQVALDARVQFVHTTADHTYVITGDFYGTSRLHVLTNSPAEVVGTRSFPTNTVGFGVHGSYVYASSTIQTSIIDVATPTDPTIVGTIDASGGVAGHGSNLVVLNNNVLTVMDNTDPASPGVLGTVGFTYTLNDIALSPDGLTAYVSSEGIDIIDLATPSAPNVVGRYDLGKFEFADQMALTTSGLFATHNSNVILLDVTDATTPSLLGSHAIDSAYLTDLAANEDAPAIAHVGVGTGAVTVDFTTPSAPSEEAFMHTGYYTADLVVEAVPTARGTQTQVTTAAGKGGIERYRGATTSDLRALPPLYAMLFGLEEDQGAVEKKRQDSFGHMMSRVNGKVKTSDVASAEATEVASVDVSGNGTAMTMGLDHLFVSQGSNGIMSVLDASDPLTLTEVSTIDGEAPIRDISWRDANSIVSIVVGTGSPTVEQVKLFTLLDPATPQLIHAFSPGSNIASVRIVGNVMIMADYDQWVYLYDITDPVTPVPLGTINLGAFVQITSLMTWNPSPPGARGETTLLIVTMGISGVAVYDITDPTTPVHMGSVDTADEAMQAVVHDDVIYVADGFSGFYAMTWDPEIPVLIGRFDGRNTPDGVALRWNVPADGNIQGYDILRGPDATSVLAGELLAPGTREYVDLVASPGAVVRYQLAVVLRDGTEVRSEPLFISTPPAGSALLGNHPNPFNPRTTITFDVAERARTRVLVYDVTGARVATLFDGFAPAGRIRVAWDGTDATGREVASGVYPYTVWIGEEALRGKMILNR